MFDRGFFTSKTGQAALVSVAAMITFVLFAEMQKDVAQADVSLTSAPVVELA